MSAITPETQKRGPGRPRIHPRPETTNQTDAAFNRQHHEMLPDDDAPRANQQAAPMWHGYPIMPDDEMEQYGGDLDALESWSRKAKRPLATWRDMGIGTTTALPDLMPKGMLVYRHAPEQTFHFVFLTEDGTSSYQRQKVTMMRRGYKPVTVADWYVHSLLRDMLIPEDGTGRLTLDGALKGGATVVYYQDEASYRRVKAYDRRQSDEIQKSAEQRRSEMQEQLNREGFGDVKTTVEFEDEQ